MNSAAKPNVLALVPVATQARIAQSLAPVVGQISFCSDASEISHMPKNCACFDVLIVPATLLEEESWPTWQNLWLTNPRQTILAYTPRADFHMWSSALEQGCYDLILEPFQEETLRESVLCAYASTHGFDT
ncbi:hypothetical protein [Silvibacterium sp.]|uniref:hypothetical protein n=1 Tax=Silvibacterium sp. TaxID=1964179 RepID=UPI0039E52B0D